MWDVWYSYGDLFVDLPEGHVLFWSMKRALAKLRNFVAKRLCKRDCDEVMLN